MCQIHSELEICWSASEPITYLGGWAARWRLALESSPALLELGTMATSRAVMPVVLALPYALVAAVVGASVAWIVESDRPFEWTLVPTFLYALGVFHSSHWAQPPTTFDRVGDAIRMLLPAAACILAGRTRTGNARSRSPLRCHYSRVEFFCVGIAERWRTHVKTASRAYRPDQPRKHRRQQFQPPTLIL
jgi:hypothetical protein